MSDVWINGECWDSEDILKMEAENKKLREALEDILNLNVPGGGEYVFDIAKEALEGL